MSNKNTKISSDKFFTFSKRAIDISNMRKEDVFLEDIAHSLSMVCRFNGHIKSFYSVARHSLMVSLFLENNNFDSKVQMCGLIHDASEAYLNDIVTPVKAMLSEYRCLEKSIQGIIYDAFNLSEIAIESLVSIKNADTYITSLEIEKFFLENEAKNQYVLTEEKAFSETKAEFFIRALRLMENSNYDSISK